MRIGKRISFQYTGLEIATLVGRFFLDTEDLHYGYWVEGLPVKTANLKQAQENYTDLIIRHIPEETRTILDVGAGNGNLSRKLQNNGFTIESLTPSFYQAEVIKSKLKAGSRVHVSRFQSCKTLGKYDLIIFSESFQYIPVKKAITMARSLLNTSGKILICDFFSKVTKDVDIFNGGHNWDKYLDVLVKESIEILIDLDITPETAPNIKLFSDLVNDVGLPSAWMVKEYLFYKYPRIMSLLRWKFRSKYRSLTGRYDKNILNAENFLKCKTYRLMLLKP